MSASSEWRAAFVEALETVRVAMRREERAARPEEIAELRALYDDWEFVGGLEDLQPDDPVVWEEVEYELQRAPPPSPVVRLHPDDLATLAARSSEAADAEYVHQGRRYTQLPLPRVQLAEGLLLRREREQKRLGVKRLPTRLGLSYEAIARKAGLPRPRVEQIEALLREGWDLRESHPEFRADSGFVKLPTPAELPRLRRSGLWRG